MQTCRASGLCGGKGLEMVITLGTGFGTALLDDGVLLPHLEIGQQPAKQTGLYDEYVGQNPLKEKERSIGMSG